MFYILTWGVKFVGLFKENILIGDTIKNLAPMLRKLEDSNIPFDFEIEDVFIPPDKLNDENQEHYISIKVRKKYVEQTKAIINQFTTMSEEEINREYKLAKKEAKKLEKKLNRKERIISIIETLFLIIIIMALNFGNSEGYSFLYIGYVLLFFYCLNSAIKYVKELRKEEIAFLRIFPILLICMHISLMIYATISFISIL